MEEEAWKCSAEMVEWLDLALSWRALVSLVGNLSNSSHYILSNANIIGLTALLGSAEDNAPLLLVCILSSFGYCSKHGAFKRIV